MQSTPDYIGEFNSVMLQNIFCIKWNIYYKLTHRFQLLTLMHRPHTPSPIPTHTHTPVRKASSAQQQSWEGFVWDAESGQWRGASFPLCCLMLSGCHLQKTKRNTSRTSFLILQSSSSSSRPKKQISWSGCLSYGRMWHHASKRICWYTAKLTCSTETSLNQLQRSNSADLQMKLQEQIDTWPSAPEYNQKGN